MDYFFGYLFWFDDRVDDVVVVVIAELAQFVRWVSDSNSGVPWFVIKL